MTRRSFLKNIVGALAVLALPVAVKAAAEERIKDAGLPSGPLTQATLEAVFRRLIAEGAQPLPSIFA